jgi:hypothetical protein
MQTLEQMQRQIEQNYQACERLQARQDAAVEALDRISDNTRRMLELMRKIVSQADATDQQIENLRNDAIADRARIAALEEKFGR